MNYLSLELELCAALKALGWIESVHENRDGSWINWTEKGKAYHHDFESSVLSILDYSLPERRKFLHEFAIEHGLITPTRVEAIIRQIGYMVPDEAFLLVICPCNGVATYRVVVPPVDKDFYELVEKADTAGHEVLFFEMADIAKAKIPITTPFGAKGFWRRS